MPLVVTPALFIPVVGNVLAPLAGVPLEAEVLDARGLVVKRERLRVAAGASVLSRCTRRTGAPAGKAWASTTCWRQR